MKRSMRTAARIRPEARIIRDERYVTKSCKPHGELNALNLTRFHRVCASLSALIASIDTGTPLRQR